MWTLGFPGCSPLCPLLQPPHVPAAHLSHTHRNRYMSTHCRPVGEPLWKGCWKLSGPPLLCTEEGLRLGEGRVLCRSHTTHLGQGLELSLALSIPHPMVQSPAPSCRLFPTTEPFSQPLYVSWGRRPKGRDICGSDCPWKPLLAPCHSSAHCHLLATGSQHQ